MTTHGRELSPCRDEQVTNEGAISTFVETLCRECSKATLDLALRVGRLVIDTFYGGDLTVWKLRGKSHPSLRRLARRPDLPISAPQLYRCVAIYELTVRLPGVSTWKHLGTSHVRTVIGLPQADQERLIEVAERERWTVQRLQSEVHRLRAEVRSRRGRPPLSDLSKVLASIKRWLDECPDSIPSFDPLGVDAETLAGLRARVSIVRDRCLALEALLRFEQPKGESPKRYSTS